MPNTPIIVTCWDTDCKFNNELGCLKNRIEIDRNGKCVITPINKNAKRPSLYYCKSSDGCEYKVKGRLATKIPVSIELLEENKK